MNDYTYSGTDFDSENKAHVRHSYNNGPEDTTPSQDNRTRQPRNKRKRDISSRDEAESGLPGFISRPVAFFTSRKMKSVAGIALILIAAYLSVAALSFLKHSGADQSEVVSQSVGQMAQTPGAVENIAGPAGAKASHHLFVEGLGLGSVVLIIYMVLIGLGLLGLKKIKFWSLTFKSLILAITVSFVLGLLTINTSADLPPGGYHGRYINILLISRIGWIGAFIVSCLLVTVLVTIYIAELTRLYQKSREKIRLVQAKKIHDQDRKVYEQDIIDNALADGPINVVVEENKEPVRNIDNQTAKYTTPLAGFDNTDAGAEFDDRYNRPVTDTGADSTEKAVRNNTAARTLHNDSGPEAHTATSSTSDTAGQATAAPEFEVNEAAEIEQSDNENQALRMQGPYDPRAELSCYRMPSLDLLHDRPRKTNSVDLAEQEENKERITKTLNDYGIQIVKIEATVGPTVTLYEIIPAEGVRIARIKRLEDDIAMSLAALGIRIIAPIPGKGTIGIEVPNKDPQTVSIRSILGSRAFQECKYPLPMALGATISNDVYIADLTKMPHLLVAGATGQGKSVGLNTIIASLLYKRHPSELKFVLVDPKMVEFSLYARLEKHYLAKLPDAEEPVVTDPNKVVDTLNSLCVEMDARYSLLKDAGCRSVIEYNDKFIHRRLNPEKGHRYMPYIVMIVDEFADLIMMAGKAVETPIARIAQKARAVGMHMIIATQRPSTNVITGIIKANFPGRIGFRVSQMVDSRTILDSPGANQLIGRGDMLISTGGMMERVQCAFIDTDEVDAICHHINDQIGFTQAYILPEPPSEAGEIPQGSLSERDSLFDEIARLVVQGNTASTSNIQRKYSIGYNRAGKIMDQLEAAGIVGPAQGGKPRNVLVDPTQLEMILDSL